MKKLVALILLALTLTGYSQTASTSPLMINKTTGVVSNSLFFSANASSLLTNIVPSFNASFVILVSPDGNDTTALTTPATTPFLTLKAAFSNAPNNCVIKIAPGVYNQTPVYHNVGDVEFASFLSDPATLYNKTNLYIVGNGAVITGAGTGTHIAIVASENVHIEGLKLDLTKGTGSELTGSYCGAIQGFGTNRNLSFNRIQLNNATDQGITFDRAIYGLSVRNSKFYNIGSTNVNYILATAFSPYVDGTAISGVGSDTVVEGCYFDTCYRCLEFDDYAGMPLRHSGFKISNCIATNLLEVGVFTACQNTNTAIIENIDISNNLFHKSSNSGTVDSRLYTGNPAGVIQIKGGRNVRIIGNAIRNTHDYGINIAGASPVENVVIAGNIIEGGTTGATNIYNIGIALVTSSNATNPYTVKDIVISGNQISELGNTAIQVLAANVDVNGNQAWKCGKYANGAFVYLFGGSTGVSNCIVRGNSYFDSKSSGQNYLLVVGTNAKKVYFTRDNFGRNIDTSLASTPLNVNAGSVTEVFADGKTLVATLVGGTITTNYPLVHANSRVMVSRNITGGTAGHLSLTRVNETSITVNSSSGTDTSSVALIIWEDQF